MELRFNDGTIVGSGSPPYIVAEVNSSHNGNVDVAKQMIDAAVAAGCDCVKFQSFTVDSLYSKNYYDENAIAKRFVQKFSFGNDELKECADYCKTKRISFSSTPYSKSEVDFLAGECNVPFIKIASMEINNLPFLIYIAQKQLPIVLSTGMADIDEIKTAVRAIESTGNKQMVILHCVSLYPVDAKDVNLNNIRLLQDTFSDYPIGYSDHTLGYEVASAAVAMGAVLIEKHLTLDHTKIGMDNQMATEPEDMARLVQSCKTIFSALGNYERILNDNELEQRAKMRRSLVYTRDILAGSVLTADDLDAKRPGTGIEPGRAVDFIGKSLCRDVKSDILVVAEDIR